MSDDSINRLLGEFVVAWNSGARPSIEQFLARAPRDHRSALLADLLSHEIRSRRAAGEDPNLTSYESRFGDQRDVVAQVFAGSMDTGTLETIDQGPISAAKRPAAAPNHESLITRCPHCQSPIDVGDGSSLTELTCGSCGSSFSLIEGQATATVDHNPLRRVGHFELVEQLGVGTFGSVWKARDTTLDRIVAIKIPRKGQLDANEMEQFFREARAAAQLRHPNIVSIHEVGRDGTTIFIVSDLVQGVTLSDWLSGQQPTPREAAQICAQVGEALQHAHDKGVIHRDLKPGNIMLDDQGQPHIMDFGLAKREAGEVTMTVEGRVLGTPAYMSPEQARGESHQADPRTDVYSLGVILFQLLTGELPFRGTPRMLLHQVLNEEPRSPRSLNDRVPRDLETICLKAMAKEPVRRYATVRAMAADLRHFLAGEPIEARPVGSLERGWRWANRNRGLAALAGSLAAILLIGAIGSSVVALAMSRLANDEKASADRARVAEQAARAAETTARTAEASARAAEQAARASAEQELVEKQRAEESKLKAIEALNQSERDRRLAEEREKEAHHNQYLARISQAQAAWKSGNVAAVLELLDTLEPRGDEPDLRGPEFYRLLEDCHRSSRTLRGHVFAVRDVVFSPQGDKLFSVSEDSTVRVWQLADQGQDLIYPVKGAIYRCVALAPDGSMFALGLGGTAVFVDAAKKTVIGSHRQLHDDTISSMAFSVDGKRLLSTSQSGDARLWSVPALLALGENDKPKPEHRWRQVGVGAVAGMYGAFCSRLSPDGKTAAVGFGARLMLGDGEVRLWDCESGELRATLKGHKGAVYSIAFSPDGKSLVSGSADRSWRRWDLQTQDTLTERKFHKGSINAIDISSDGQRLVTGSTDRSIAIWDLNSAELLRSFVGHTDTVSAVRFSPDGASIASGSGDATVRVWNTRSEGDVVLQDATPKKPASGGLASLLGLSASASSAEFVTSVNVTPDGLTLIAAVYSVAGKGRVEYWDLEKRQLLRKSEAPKSGFLRSTLLLAGTQVAVVAGGMPFSNSQPGKAKVTIYDVSTGDVVRSWDLGSGLAWGITCSSDGKTLATGSPGLLEVWNSETGQRIFADQFPANHTVTALDYSPDGRLGAAATSEGVVRLYDIASGRSLGELPRRALGAFSLAFSPDSKSIVVGFSKSPFENVYAEAELCFYNVETKTLERRVGGLMLGVVSVSWTSDGRRLLATTADGNSKLFDTQTGTELMVFEGKSPLSITSCLAPDGKSVAVGGMEGAVQLFDLKLSRESELAWHERHAAQAVDAGDWRRVVECLDAQVALDPRNPLLHYQRARAYWELNDLDQMYASWAEAAALGDAEFLKPYAATWIGSMYGEAYLFQIRNNIPRLARAFEIIELLLRSAGLKNTPEMADVLWRLANTRLYLAHDPDQALPPYREVWQIQRALKQDGGVDAISQIHQIAQGLRGRNEYALAETIYRELVAGCPEIYPKQPWNEAVMVWTLGETLRDSKRPAEAEPYYRQALAQFRSLPTPSEYVINAVEMELADVLRRQGKPVESSTPLKNVSPAPKPLEAAEFPKLEDQLPGQAANGLVMQVLNKNKTVVTRRSAQIDACWGYHVPGTPLPTDNITVRWTGWLKPQRAGKTRLITVADDRVRVWIDGKLVVDDWTNLWNNRTEVEMDLSDNPVPIQLEAFNGRGVFNANCRWIPPGESRDVVIPASAFFLTREAAAAAPPTSPGPKRPGLQRQIFRGTEFQELLSTDEEDRIDSWWCYGGPSLSAPANFFSIRWTGTLTAPSAGKYRLITFANDYARVWLDDKLVIDNWGGQAVTRNEAEVDLTGSAQSLRVEFKETSLLAFFSFRWSVAGAEDDEVVPPTALGPPKR